MYKYIIVLLLLINLVQAANIKINEQQTFANGFNNIVEITIDEGMRDVRVFFKDHQNPKYQIYVKAKCINYNCYAKLPITLPELISLDYTVLYLSADGGLGLSSEYTVIKKDLLELPTVQAKHKREKVLLYSEFEVPPSNVIGFGRNLVLLPTEKHNILGIRAGFYYNSDVFNAPKKVEHKCKECKTVILHDSDSNYAVSNFIIEIIEGIDRAIKEILK